MAQKRYKPEQIVVKLRDAERLQGQGMSIQAICKRLGITDVTYYRWRTQYGSLKADEAQRLKALELENERLKRLVAEKELDILILKEVSEGKF